MNHTIRSRRGTAICLALLTAVSLSACGGTSLADEDKKVCDAAASGDAHKVFDVASLAKNADISKQAQRIRMGSSDSSDEDAMKQIVSICKDSGYTPKGADQ